MPLLLKFKTDELEAGVDEAGRGCLAGPVVAAAVILPGNFENDEINDSKQLNEKRRNELRTLIMKQAVAWGVGVVSPKRIDEINILNASHEAMHIAIAQLKITPTHLLIDGNRFKKHAIPSQCMIKGDARFMNIAAASILAKTHRDAIMLKLHKKFPHYSWNTNMGYPTKAHRAGIVTHGVTPHHRLSFTLLPAPTLFD